MSMAGAVLEFVTDIVMDAVGVTRSKGPGGDDIESVAAWHFGFYSRPKDGARGVVLKADGQGNTSFLIGYRDKQYELSLQKGEVGLKNAFNAQILLDKDGNVNATAADGAYVLLGGGNGYVALASPVKAWFDAFNAAVNGWTPVANDGGGALKTALATLTGGTPTTSVAAQNVKAT